MSADVAVQRWSADQIAALAPDPASLKNARGLGSGKWRDAGVSGSALWGLCLGSATYQVCIDLAEPAYRCSCPSRKFPCKHALGLLLQWSAGSVAEGERPQYLNEWFESRADRAAKAEKRAEKRENDPAAQRAAARRAEKRDERIVQGVAELHRWLTDQVRDGLASLSGAGYQHFDTMAARLVDAQAPGLAGSVKRLASVAIGGDGSALLAEISMLHLLTRAYARLDELPEELAASVRARVGQPTSTEQVLARPAVRDMWQIIGMRDQVEEKLTTRRVWLRGRDTGRPALVLSFGIAGQPLAADLVVGTAIDADLCFYPAAVPLRALVATRHGSAVACDRPVTTTGLETALADYATALAAEPWLEEWPIVLDAAELVPPSERQPEWGIAVEGRELLLHPLAPAPWRLAAAAGGEPMTIAVEMNPAGVRPLAGWTSMGVVRP